MQTLNLTQHLNAYSPQYFIGSQEVVYCAHLGGALMSIKEDLIVRSGLAQAAWVISTCMNVHVIIRAWYSVVPLQVYWL